MWARASRALGGTCETWAHARAPRERLADWNTARSRLTAQEPWRHHDDTAASLRLETTELGYGRGNAAPPTGTTGEPTA